MNILVTGATGNVGGAVLRALLRRNHRLRALTRDPAKAALPPDVEIVRGDFSDADSIAAALRGIEAVHLINVDAGGPIREPERLVAMLQAAGVARVTTFRGLAAGALEAALSASPLGWAEFSIPVEFSTNALHWARSIREEGLVRVFGPVKSAVIHIDDVGTVIASALADRALWHRRHTLTGPEALTPRDKVEAIARATGQEIALVALSEAEAREIWRKTGASEAAIDAIAAWYKDTPAEAYTVTRDLETLLGRKPRSFADWAQEHAAAFLPEVPKGQLARGAGG